MALPQVKIRVTADTKGAESGVRRVTSGLDRMTGAAERAESRSRTLGTSMRGLDRRSAGLQRGIQNAAFQMGDFAVQVGAGTAASRALALQLPQLLGGFGVLGAVLGATVAIAFPLRTAMQGLADDSRDLSEVFGTLQPVAEALSRAFTSMREAAVGAAELLINNIDRLLVIGATAATFFAGRWVAAFVAARVATLSLSGALLVLRNTLIRTGFGILIVGAGELVFQFTRLAKAAGTVAEAIGALKDVAAEVFERVQILASAAADYLGGQFLRMQAFFVNAISNMAAAASDFFRGLADGLQGVPGMEGMAGNFANVAGNIGRVAGSINQSAHEIYGRAQDALGRAGAGFDAASGPLESITRIRDMLRGMKEERITLPDILGVGGEDGEGGGAGGGSGEKSLDEKLSEQEKRVSDHFERIKALTQGSLSDKLGAWGNYFDNLTALTQSKNEKLLRIGKAFAAAQALLDAWQAHNQVLADPTLPWFAKLASAANVLAAGIGAVNAIRSVSEGGGSAAGAAGGGAGSASGGTATAAAPLDVYVHGIEPGQLYTGEMVASLFDQMQKEAGARGLRVTFPQ